MKLHKMDSVNKTDAIYKKIYKSSAMIFGTLAFVYYYFKAQYAIGNNFFAMLIFQIFSLGILATFSYSVSSFIGERRWTSKNRGIYLRGTWLHMHIKGGEVTRIGWVEIKQSFYNISAVGHNIDFSISGNYNSVNDSNWNYYMGSVYDDPTQRDYIGCYSKNRDDGNSNDGLHMMTIETDRDGRPNRIYGHFMDTFAINKEIEDTENHKGHIQMFKLTEPMREYLIDENGFNYEKLASVHINKQLKDEPFVRKLKELNRKTETNKRK